MKKIFTILFVLLTLESALSKDDSNPCENKLNCKDCIQTANCHWCLQPEFKQARCFPGEFLKKNYCPDKFVQKLQNSLTVIEDKELSEALKATENVVQIKPQKVSLKLKIGELIFELGDAGKFFSSNIR